MPNLHTSLRQYEIFCAIVDAGTTAAAAQAVNLSQSAVSAALQELEASLNLALFDRVGKRLLLNGDGRALLPRARAMLDAALGIERWAHGGGDFSSLRIGASQTVGTYVLPEFLAGLSSSPQEAAALAGRLEVVIDNSAAIAAQVADFTLDVGLVEGAGQAPELLRLPWLEDELCVVCAPEDPILQAGEPLPLEALAGALWLLRETGSGTREVVEQQLGLQLGPPLGLQWGGLRTGVGFSSSEAIKRAVARGLGISCLSRHVVQDFIASGRLAAPRTALQAVTRRFHRIHHRQRQPGRALQALFARLDAFAAAAQPLRSA